MIGGLDFGKRARLANRCPKSAHRLFDPRHQPRIASREHRLHGLESVEISGQGKIGGRLPIPGRIGFEARIETFARECERTVSARRD